eukprot:GHVU01026301.1.p1 GENE.GHVU01026301.1~~GHVU01026301.1.p1  ORF type:complete len:228 (+),score=35.46 GHVU01026301.1:856-1539(+)
MAPPGDNGHRASVSSCSSRDSRSTASGREQRAEILTAKYVEARISPVELDALKRVFKWFDEDNDGSVSVSDTMRILERLGAKCSRAEAELILWAADEDLREALTWEDIACLYYRCVKDPTGLEPRGLFNVVQFLMYDRHFVGTIGAEQTLEILFVRFGRELLDQEIAVIFGEDSAGRSSSAAANEEDGPEKQINYREFVTRVMDRVNKQRNCRKGISYPTKIRPKRG